MPRVRAALGLVVTLALGLAGPAGAHSIDSIQARSAAPITVPESGSFEGGPFVLAGGELDQPSIGEAIIRLAGGPSAVLVIIPVASGEPDASGAHYEAFFRKLGAKDIRVVLPKGAPTPVQLASMGRASGLFFTGGDQRRILAAFQDPAWGQALNEAWHRGALIAGTSAGSMVWGPQAITGGESFPTLWRGEQGEGAIAFAPGFGFLKHLLVDTHFHQRGRFGRLLYAGRRFGSMGIGIDPQTAMVLHPDGEISVLGLGTVTLIRTRDRSPVTVPLSAKDVHVRLMAPGESASLAGDPVFDPLAPRP